jgi:hypothetical protein
MHRTTLPVLAALLLPAACGSSGGTDESGTGESGTAATDSSATASTSTSAGTSSSSASAGTLDDSGSTGASTASGTADSSASDSSATGDESTGEPACEPEAADTLVTYLGGSDFEHARDIVLDCVGNVYVAGGTRSPRFPSTLGGPAGSVDVFVTKYDPQGAPVWSHRFGSPNYDRAYAIELDPSGDVIVAGRMGDGFATTAGVLQETFGGDMDVAAAYGQQDAFVAKLSADGEIVWATYFGGPGRDFVRDVAVDAAGDVYLAASQVTRDHPHATVGSFDTTRASMDSMAAKIAGDGASVVWAGYLGGSGDDGPEPSIRVDAATGTAVMVVGTPADDLPVTPGAYQSTPGGMWDVFVAKIAPDGASLQYGTYVGGSGGDGLETHNLALGSDGRAWLGMITTSPDLDTTPGTLQTAYGGTGGGGTGMNTNYPGDGWIGVLSADGSTLEAATFLGGSVGDAVEGIALGPGGVYVAGGTFSSDFPADGGWMPQQGTHGGNLDGFVAILPEDLASIAYASFVGGGDWDVLRAVAVGFDGSIAGVGETRSTDLPVTANAPDSTYGGGGELDALVVRVTQ